MKRREKSVEARSCHLCPVGAKAGLSWVKILNVFRHVVLSDCLRSVRWTFRIWEWDRWNEGWRGQLCWFQASCVWESERLGLFWGGREHPRFPRDYWNYQTEREGLISGGCEGAYRWCRWDLWMTEVSLGIAMESSESRRGKEDVGEAATKWRQT